MTSLPTDTFVHEAYFYADQEDFLAGMAPFIQDGLDDGQAVMVAVSDAKIELLRSAVTAAASGADSLLFVDMATIGQNPARIIPAWREFVSRYAVGGRRVRGIGEPVWPERSPAELAECHLHESLLNVAFAGTPAWWLVCPYDRRALPSEVLERVADSHPYLYDSSARWTSSSYRNGSRASSVTGDPLPAPPDASTTIGFEGPPLGHLRGFVSHYATRAGLAPGRTDDLVLAVTETTTNSLRHGSGSGVLQVWCDGNAVICEVRDGGTLTRPLAGRVQPRTDTENGRGLWLANQLCDLVQLRSSAQGTTVRLHMRRR